MKKDMLDQLKSLMDQKRWGELAGVASTYLRDNPHQTQALLYMAIGHFQTGNILLAEKELKNFCNNHPQDETGLFYLAQCYENTKLPILADEIYDRLCKQTEELKYYIYKSVNLYNNEMYKEIKELMPRYIKKWVDVELFSIMFLHAYEETADSEKLDIDQETLAFFSTTNFDRSNDTEKIKFINLLATTKQLKKIQNIIDSIPDTEKENIHIKFYAQAKKEQVLGNIDLAIDLIKKSILHKALEENIVSLLSTIFYVKKDFSYAFKEAEKFADKDIGEKFYTGLSFLYHITFGYNKKAIKLIEKALKKHRNSHGLKINFAFSLLAEGNLKLGWKYYEIRETKSFKRNVFSLPWKGEKLNGKNILVYSEQGVGDHILFAPLLFDFERKANAKKIIFETDPRIVSLMQRSFPTIDVRAAPKEKSPKFYLHDYDYHIALASLPSLYRNKISDFDGKPFIKTDLKIDSKIQNLLVSDKKLKIGIIWKSRMNDVIRDINYLTTEELLPLLSYFGTDDINWINLQYGDADEELSLIAEKTGVLLKTWDIDLKDDFESVASLIKHLDLVITAGTAIHALAGGLGTRTWMFAPNPLWAAFNQNYYPWCNTIRLYQPPSPASMQLSIPYMIEDLEKWLKTGEAPPHRSQVLIDSKEAEEKLEKYLVLHEQKVKNQFLPEKTSEESLSEGISNHYILQKTASVRLKKRLEKINENQFFSQTTVGNLDDFSQEKIKLKEDFLFQETIKESKNTVLIFTGNDGKTLPLNSVAPYALQEFDGNKLIAQLSESDCSFLQIRDGWQMWYQVGPLGSCLLNPEKAIDEWLTLIMSKIKQSKAEKIICIGTSAGASAAIQFGAKLHADAVVAISPQARPLDGEWELENGGFSFLEEGGNWRKQVRDKFNLSPVDLKPYANELGDKLHIIVPKLNKIDITHADYLTQDNPNIQRYRSTGKNHGEVNNELFFDIIKKLI